MCNQRKGGNKKEAPRYTIITILLTLYSLFYNVISFRKLSAELNLYKRHIELLKESEIIHCPVGIDKVKTIVCAIVLRVH